MPSQKALMQQWKSQENDCQTIILIIYIDSILNNKENHLQNSEWKHFNIAL